MQTCVVFSSFQRSPAANSNGLHYAHANILTPVGITHTNWRKFMVSTCHWNLQVGDVITIHQALVECT